MHSPSAHQEAMQSKGGSSTSDISEIVRRMQNLEEDIEQLRVESESNQDILLDKSDLLWLQLCNMKNDSKTPILQHSGRVNTQNEIALKKLQASVAKVAARITHIEKNVADHDIAIEELLAQSGNSRDAIEAQKDSIEHASRSFEKIMLALNCMGSVADIIKD